MSTVEASPRRADPDATLIPHRGHLPVLDGVRGIAVLMVIFHHITFAGSPTGKPLAILWKVGVTGWCGVDLFFVLSGFLITGILLDARTGEHYFRNFYGRRTLRIFPLYYCFLALSLFVLPLVASWLHQAPASWPTSPAWFLAYGQNFWIGQHGFTAIPEALPIGHFWSLAIEEHFYLVWPLLIWLIPVRALIPSAFALIGLCIGLRVGLTRVGFSADAVYVFTFCRMDALLLGAIPAIAVRMWRHITVLRLARVCCVAAVLLLIAMLAYLRGFNWTYPLMHLYGFTLLAIIFSTLLVLALAASPQSLPGRILRWRLLRTCGKYSYAMYIFHPLVQLILGWALPLATLESLCRGRDPALLLQGTLILAATAFAAFVSWHLLEKHFLALKRIFEPASRT
jgi:peptidoglycan/LPS O-acetylase OafA/YrhL